MRRAVFALFVAMFVAPTFAGEKKAKRTKKEKSVLPPLVQVTFTRHLRHLERLTVCKVEGPIPCSDRLFSAASGKAAGFPGSVTGHTLNGSLPVELFTDSDGYHKLESMFGQGQGYAEIAQLLLAGDMIHELCHGLGQTREVPCYELHVAFLESETRMLHTVLQVLEEAIAIRRAQLEACRAGKLLGCEAEVSSAIPEAKTSPPAN